MHQRRLSRNSYRLRRVFYCGFKVANLVNQLHRQSLLAGPNLTVGDGFHVVDLDATPVRHRVHELSEHIVDQRLHVGLLGWSEVAGRIPSILELSGLDDDIFQLGPLQQIPIVHPLRDHADRANDTALIGINLVRGRGNIVGAAGTHGLDGHDNILFFLLADTLDLAVNLFRCSHAAARGIHVQDDGFDGRIIGKLFQFADHRLWRKNHSVKVNHSNTVAKSAKPRFIVVRVQSEVNQREHSQDEEEESSSANQYPEKGAGTSLSHEVKFSTAASGREHLQRRTLNRNLDGGSADVFAVGINVEWSLGFHAHPCRLEVIHFANTQMVPKVDCGKHARQLEGIDTTDHAHIELTVVESRVRGDFNAAAISRGIGESCE